jgi:hypothetical protein
MLLPFLLYRGRYFAKLLDFGNELQELRALHIGDRIIEVCREFLNKGNYESIEVSQLLLGISEEIV